MTQRMDELQEKLIEIQSQIKVEKDKPKAEIATRLQAARKRNTKYTQTDMSEFLGISRTQYTNMEIGNGWPTVKNLIQVCTIIKTTPNYILGFEEKGGA